jgi:hypothetical protein
VLLFQDKVLANRLKLVAENIIWNSQYAFTKCRQTLDDTLIANEEVDERLENSRKRLFYSRLILKKRMTQLTRII